MATFSVPGVYVEEKSGGARPIEAVGTSTAAFIGKAPNPETPVGKVIPINNWSEFKNKCATSKDKDDKEIIHDSTDLSNAVYGFFANGGSYCYIVNVNNGNLKDGLELLDKYEDISIVAAPGYTDGTAHDHLITHCDNLKGNAPRMAILDSPAKGQDNTSDSKEPRATSNTESGQQKPANGSTSNPTPEASSQSGQSKSSKESNNTHTEQEKDSKKQKKQPSNPSQLKAGTETGDFIGDVLKSKGSHSEYGTLYFPWLVAQDPLHPIDNEGKPNKIDMPPSGHIAGVWARTDSQRGVHKAPANEAVRGAVGLSYQLTHGEQERLNPKGINCIRSFPGEGIKVWGARTLAPSSSEWKYLNVRRLFNMIKKSIMDSTRWIVFEPNDYTLWKSIERDVTAFLTGLWRAGMLMGKTPEEAFFVMCNEETNPPDVRDRGQVITKIGIAPVKPAEFVIFEISQTQDGAATSSSES